MVPLGYGSAVVRRFPNTTGRWVRSAAAVAAVAVGAGVLQLGTLADAEPERPEELPGSGGRADDLADDRPYGPIQSESCDLLCEIAEAESRPRQPTTDRAPYPVVTLGRDDELARVAALLDAGTCDGPGMTSIAGSSGDPLVQWLQLRALVCAGDREKAGALYEQLKAHGLPGFESELQALGARLSPATSPGLLPSLAVDGRAFLSRRLAAARDRASAGDVDGALAELGALDAQVRTGSARRRIAHLRAEILERADRKEEAACAFYQAWTRLSGRARAEMSERLDGLAAQGVDACQIDLGERLESDRDGLAARKASRRKGTIARLARRYDLSAKDRRALDALGRGQALSDARDRAGALAPYEAAIELADHPEIVARARFDRGTALRRLDRDDDAVVAYALVASDAPNTAPAPEALYQAGRLSVYLGNYEQAREYLALFVVSYPDGARLPDALWQAGWSDWRRGDVPSAVRLFEQLGRHHGTKRDRSGLPFEARALYWRARGLARMGRNDDAIDGYRFVMERFPLTYYAALAHHRIASLGVRPEDAVPFLPCLSAPVDPAAIGDLDAIEVPLHPRLRRAVALWRTGRHGEARDELQSQLGFAGVPRGVVEILATLHAADGNYPSAHWVATRYGDFRVAPYDGNWRLWALAHPVPPKLWKAAKEAAADTGLDPALAMAIIRHESSFRTGAVVSHRGAVGPMQLMPATAKAVYRTWYGKEGPGRKGLGKADPNVRSGMAMFALLDHVYSGNTPLMIAAYNAGPGVAARWWRDGQGLETDALVEEMTYPGTVAYLKKVLGSWYTYRVLYGDGSPPPIPLAPPERLREWERPGADLIGVLDTPLTLE